MTLAAGTRLGAYDVLALIGAGGMGEVYRAKDSRLHREVALKVLPDLWASDPDRLARFEREARLVASLNHPNIAAIHGLEDVDGTRILVLELVEGETLADRLARSEDRALPNTGSAGVSTPAITVEDALTIAIQIADALEAAHEKGVIHRDLKPANIKITPEGKVKVLDFGLAKALEGEGAAADVSQSPTLSFAATRMGVILGTAAYMSPEQAKGRTVDKRTDIWAFGCVLYEMLAGRPAFPGDDVSEILASVLKSPPALDLLPADIHPKVRDVLGRCLEKDSKKRFRDIGDVRCELEQVLADPRGTLIPPAAGGSQSPPRPMLPWFVTAAVLAAIVAGAAVWYLKPEVAEPAPIARFNYVLPQDQVFRSTGRPVVALSPDGRHFVYNTMGGLYLRSMDAPNARLIPGTEENLSNPFFSPDGQWIAFFSFADSQLKKVPIAGGTPVALGAATNPFDAIWEADNTIVFGQPEGIMRVSANGGTPELLVATGKNEQVHGPRMLPGGQWVLFTISRSSGLTRWNVAEIVAQSLASGERKVLWRGGGDARYVPTGHLVYSLDDTLFALPFDLDRLEVTGGPVPMVAGLQRPISPATSTATAHYGLSDRGTLIYVAGASVATQARDLVWVDRQGAATPVLEQPAEYRIPRISPDGQRIAVVINEGGNEDIWIIEPDRGVRTRLTSDPAREIYPLWTRDSARITFTSSRGGAQTLYWMPADGSGTAEPLTKSGRNPGANSWSPDGKTLALHEGSITGTGNYDLWTMTLGNDPAPFLATPFRERGAAFSPDGRWLAYSSDESGRDEVYVQPYPGPGGKVTISNGGGRSPLWSAGGRELLYRNGNRMMAVAAETSPRFHAGVPRLLFEGNFAPENSGAGANDYDVSADGQRFLMLRPVVSDTSGEPPRPQINIVLNWFEDLKRLAPVN
jgi:Tol biopolymer transport system component